METKKIICVYGKGVDKYISNNKKKYYLYKQMLVKEREGFWLLEQRREGWYLCNFLVKEEMR